jgi:hypothetical protein
MLKIFKYVGFCCIFHFAINCFPQEPPAFPSIDESDLPEAQFETPKAYNGASLFGYINGGAELFLEYGFSGAWVNEIQFMGGNFTAEIYRMNGPEEAFGIFSVSRFRCLSTPPLSPFTCQTKYQLQLCAGSFYVSIINTTGNKRDSLASLKIGEAIVSKIYEKPVDFTGYLPGISAETLNREAFLAKGHLGIMNGAPVLADYFGETTGYCAVILQGETQNVLSVRFTTKEDMMKFAALHHWDLEKFSAGLEITIGAETIALISDLHLLITSKK